MRKFNKKEFSIKPIIKPMVILSVILTFVSFYVMREFSILANSNLFEAKSGNYLNKGVVTDREVEHAGRIFLLVFNTCTTLFLNLVCISFVLGFVLSIYRMLNLLLSSFRKVLFNIKYSIKKAILTISEDFSSQQSNDLYLVNSIILN